MAVDGEADPGSSAMPLDQPPLGEAEAGSRTSEPGGTPAAVAAEQVEENVEPEPMEVEPAEVAPPPVEAPQLTEEPMPAAVPTEEPPQTATPAAEVPLRTEMLQRAQYGPIPRERVVDFDATPARMSGHIQNIWDQPYKDGKLPKPRKNCVWMIRQDIGPPKFKLPWYSEKPYGGPLGEG